MIERKVNIRIWINNLKINNQMMKKKCLKILKKNQNSQ